MLERILSDATLHEIIIDVGMPVQHRGVNYNCRIICFNSKILLIRPKQWLANDSNYFEMRYFTPWVRPTEYEQYHLPRIIQKFQGSTHVMFGEAVISSPDTCIGVETCEELFTPDPPHTHLALDGVEIFTNSSGSHFELRKLHLRLSLIQEGIRSVGGCYLYANQIGCDSDRLYYDGCAMIIVNGQVVAQGAQFSLNEVDVVAATIDLEEIRAYRSAASRGLQAAMSKAKYERIQTSFALSSDSEDRILGRRPNKTLQPKCYSPEEEIALSTGCYLWDYLVRSRQIGYLLPLSGGIDSASTAVMVFSMARIVIDACKAGNKQVIADVKRLSKPIEELPKTPQELCNRLFHTIFMGMSKQSSRETRARAKLLSEAIGSYHIDLDIDEVYNAQRNLIVQALNLEPKFKVEGGSTAENQTLQNIQAYVPHKLVLSCCSNNGEGDREW